MSNQITDQTAEFSTAVCLILKLELIFTLAFSFATGGEGELESAEVCWFITMFIVMAVVIANV